MWPRLRNCLNAAWTELGVSHTHTNTPQDAQQILYSRLNSSKFCCVICFRSLGCNSQVGVLRTSKSKYLMSKSNCLSIRQTWHTPEQTRFESFWTVWCVLRAGRLKVLLRLRMPRASWRLPKLPAGSTSFAWAIELHPVHWRSRADSPSFSRYACSRDRSTSFFLCGSNFWRSSFLLRAFIFSWWANSAGFGLGRS